MKSINSRKLQINFNLIQLASKQLGEESEEQLLALFSKQMVIKYKMVTSRYKQEDT